MFGMRQMRLVTGPDGMRRMSLRVMAIDDPA